MEHERPSGLGYIKNTAMGVPMGHAESGLVAAPRPDLRAQSFGDKDLSTTITKAEPTPVFVPRRVFLPTV